MSKCKVCPQCGGTGLFSEFDGTHTKCVICKGRGVVNQARYEAMVDYWYARALPTAEDPVSEIVRDRRLDELDAWWNEDTAASAGYSTALGQAFANVLGRFNLEGRHHV